VHDHCVILLLPSHSLLSHALVCVPIVPSLSLVLMYPLVLLGVFVLPRPSHLSASASAIHMRFFLASSLGLEFPWSSAVVMERNGWRRRRDALTDARSECCSFLSWPFLNLPPFLLLWYCVGCSFSFFPSISCAPSHLCCVSFCVRSELITSHLSLPCVVTKLMSNAQSPTSRNTASRSLDRELCWRPSGLEFGAFGMMLVQLP